MGKKEKSQGRFHGPVVLWSPLYSSARSFRRTVGLQNDMLGR